MPIGPALILRIIVLIILWVFVLVGGWRGRRLRWGTRQRLHRNPNAEALQPFKQENAGRHLVWRLGVKQHTDRPSWGSKGFLINEPGAPDHLGGFH